jgi:uncharacterized protein YyaL (SSP411 family)
VTKEKHTNRLIKETSPYLLQHAHNPVDWHPWGDEALERARKEDKPILLSIGYSACHWCHVMERECFENEEIARLMNENFVNIKVDREERPDLDAIYMDALQAMSGGGGWPMTVFLTPQGKPFYGGTYFPPEERHGMMGFPRVLQTLAQAYKTRKSDLESAAEEVIAHLNQAAKVPGGVEPLHDGMLDSAYIVVKAAFDSQNAGFGSAPKFPQPMVLEFLLRYYHCCNEKHALLMVERTLERMASGGIYDQIGGGFHRYSVDSRWLVPHFEKMLYDNAQLSRLYLHAYQATGNRLYRRIAQETLDYVLREMTDKEGGFYSTQDADSEGVEGKYFTWTPEEVKEVLGEDDGELVSRYFGITEQGNFEGENVLSQVIEIEKLAEEVGLTPEELEASIDLAKVSLLQRRAQRVPPHRDEKVLANWNGLMLAGLAEAAAVLNREEYLEAAISNATFLMQALREGKLLKHSYKDGQARGDGYLQDYALLCEGLLSLYEATFQERWLKAAVDLGDAIVDRFWDETQGFFYDTAYDQETLIVRPRNIFDNVLPSGSSAAAFVLIRLAKLTNNNEYERLATVAMSSMQGFMPRYPLGFGHWLSALDFYLSEPAEIAVVGSPGDVETKLLMTVITRRYLPNKVLVGRDPNEPAPTIDVPLLQDRGMIENKPTVYLCEKHVCRVPVTEADALATMLDER